MDPAEPRNHPEPVHGGELRTASAARQLFSALASDTVRFARKLVPVRRELVTVGRRAGRAVPRLLKLAIFAGVFAALALATALLWALYDAPMEGRSGLGGPSLVIEAANGQPLGRVGQLGDAVGRQSFPPQLINAVVSIEDRRFYNHWGVDVWGVSRALWANWAAGGIVEGGSTITQQLAKLELVGDERTLRRKVKEALTALWLELRLSKDEILTQYLNNVYLGSGAHGMAAAARIYFDKSLSQLTLPEAAMLAGLIKAPSRYNPVRNLDAAQRRAALVIDAMLDTGSIDAKAAAAAKADPARLRLSPQVARVGSWFADWIAKDEYPKLAGSGPRSIRVRTTIIPEVQQVAERTVNDVLAGDGAKRGASQAALVAMRPDGAVVAMVGGRDYDASQFNRAVDAKRQPGSAFKLFVYYAALLDGYSPNDTIDASPVRIRNWEPENFGGGEYGKMSLTDAFARSINTAAVRLAMQVGLDKVTAAARQLGLDAPLTEVPSMALGANDVTLLDLTGAYASVRAGRPKLEPWGIAAFGPEGSGLRTLGAPAGAAQGLPKQQELSGLLHAVVEHGTGHAAALDNDTAGKTGTSQDYRDAWFIGFNKALVVGVWVGNDDRSPMKGVTGGSLPAEIWKRFVSAATPLLESSEQHPSEAPANEVAAVATPDAGQAQCDQAACSAAYDSFRASDCTYQPHDGPRRLCTRGTPQPAPSTLSHASAFSAPALCDRERCARRYTSFNPADCTYQPSSGGPRRMCGTRSSSSSQDHRSEPRSSASGEDKAAKIRSSSSAEEDGGGPRSFSSREKNTGGVRGSLSGEDNGGGIGSLFFGNDNSGPARSFSSDDGPDDD